MSDFEADHPLGANVSLPYLSDFRRHVDELRAHVLGQASGQLLQPSFIPPCSYWTSVEKDVFFHALTTYSRLRPDLIAASIRTKNTLDVYVYLENLEEAASQISKDQSLRNSQEPAVEMSKSWIALEEWNARGLDDPTEGEHSDGVFVTAKRNFVETELSVMESMLRESETNLADPDAALEEMQTSHQADDFKETGPPTSSSPSRDATSRSPLNLTSELLPPEALRSSDVATQLEGEVIPAHLSPSSRRRFLKRIYMRRKRATRKGRDVDAVSVKLRPGRQVKPRRPPKPRPRSYKQHALSDNAMSDEDPPDEGYARGNKGGFTKAYRYKQQLGENGIDAETIEDENLAFFHLSTLGKLVSLYFSGYRPASLGGDVSISADVIRLLTAITIEFTTEVLHRAIIISEQEYQMKGDIRVWKHSHDQVTVESIKLALEMMGVSAPTKEAYFADLLQEDLRTEQESDADVRRSGSGLITSTRTPHQHEKTAKGTPWPIGLAADLRLHRELYPSQFYLPKAYVEMTEDSGAIFVADDGDDETRQELGELEAVMAEEAELNDLDMQASSIYEDDLWSQMLQS